MYINANICPSLFFSVHPRVADLDTFQNTKENFCLVDMSLHSPRRLLTLKGY